MGRRPRVQSARLGGIAAGVLAGVALAAPGAAAQEPPASTIGTAKAVAVVLRVAPTVGALELALGSGISVADVQNTVAQAQSETADLGLIGSTLTAEGCDGGDPTFEQSDLPHPLRIDNRGGDATAEETSAPLVPGMLSAGVQQVRATTQPLSEAVSTTGKLTVGPLVAVDGGKATTTTEFQDGGAVRIAHGVVTLDLGIPGVLELSGLRWDALHRTGTDPLAEASFTMGAARVAGQALPVQGLDSAAAFEVLNTALEPFGITLTAPVVERFTEPADVVRITPLRVRYGDSLLGPVVLGPVLDVTRQIRDDLAAQLVALQCDTASAFLIAEIALGQVSGTGSTTISIGGAEATTGLEAIENPFGEGGLLTPPAPVAPPASAPAVGAAAPPASAAAPAAPAPIAPTQQIGSFERVCESVHPFQWPSCSAGAGPFVGIGALAATLAIAGLDWAYQRRRSAKPPLGATP